MYRDRPISNELTFSSFAALSAHSSLKDANRGDVAKYPNSSPVGISLETFVANTNEFIKFLMNSSFVSALRTKS